MKITITIGSSKSFLCLRLRLQFFLEEKIIFVRALFRLKMIVWEFKAGKWGLTGGIFLTLSVNWGNM